MEAPVCSIGAEVQMANQITNQVKKNMMDRLTKLAGGSPSVEPEIESAIDNRDISRIEDAALRVSRMYPENKSMAFSAFQRSVQFDSLGTAGKKHYWSVYSRMYPGSVSDANKSIVQTITKAAMTKPTLDAKEYYLRDVVTTLPSEIASQFQKPLAGLGAITSSANLSKAQQLYRQGLMERLISSLDSDLDPDVPFEVHREEFARLERMNLLPQAKVYNGRLGILDSNGSIRMAIDIPDRTSVDPAGIGAPAPDEELMVSNLSADLISMAVRQNLERSRDKVKLDNRLVQNTIREDLTNGNFKTHEWANVFNILSEDDPLAVVSNGLKGEINSGRISSPEELQQGIFMALDLYSSVLGSRVTGEMNGNTTTGTPTDRIPTGP